MTRQDVIEELQSQVSHNHIADIDELTVAIRKTGLDIDAYEDVLHPMSHNTCDRCGDIHDSEVGFFWLDGFDWEGGNSKDQAILKAIGQEGKDYCAICYKCVNELDKKGRE